jgi:hypothetical protein
MWIVARHPQGSRAVIARLVPVDARLPQTLRGRRAERDEWRMETMGSSCALDQLAVRRGAGCDRKKAEVPVPLLV